MKDLINTSEFFDLEKRTERYKWGSRDWSDWGLLFRFLIIICRLLAGEKPEKKKRKPSPWQIFLGKEMRAGKSIKEAAEIWKSRTQKVGN